MNLKNTYLFIIFFAMVSHLQAQDGMPYRRGKIKHRISFGAIKSFYQNHPQHTVNTKALFGFKAGYEAELLFGRRANLLVGLEYQSTGLRFQGYYKKPGYTYLFDETYAYTHELRIQEAQLPISLKISFNFEKEHFYSPYFIGGVTARYIFSSYTVITNDSTGITTYDGKDNIDFENQIFIKGLNANFHIGLGLQYNYRNSGRAVFFEMQYKYNVSRIHYDGNDNSNNLNIRDQQLVFTVGFRL